MQKYEFDLKANTIKGYTEELDEVGTEPDAVARKMMELINRYIKDYEGFKARPHSDEYDVPNVAEFLYGMKQKLTTMALDDEKPIDLRNDKYSNFIKAYLNNPIDAILKQCDAKRQVLEDLISYQMFGVIDLGDADYREISRKNDILRNRIDIEKNNYIKCTTGKNDVWKERQELNAKWFDNYFRFNAKADIGEAIRRNKPGVFEKIFRRTSNEYKTFTKNLNEVMQKGSTYGDLRELKLSAIAYLGHKFPGDMFLEEDPFNFNEEKFNQMDATAQGRIRLVRSVLEAIESAEEAVREGRDPNNFVPEEIDLDQYDMNNVLAQMMAQNNQQKVNLDFQNQIKDDTDEIIVNNYDINNNNDIIMNNPSKDEISN